MAIVHDYELNPLLRQVYNPDYNTTSNGIRYGVYCFTYPHDSLSHRFPKEILDGGEKGAAEAVHGTITDEADVFPGNKLSRKFSVSVPDQNKIALMRVFYAGSDQVIMVWVLGSADDVHNSSVDRFFNSMVFPDISNSPY